MLVLESKTQRRLLVRLDQGEELLASLSKLAEEEGVSAAWVRGVGTLEWVELDRHDQGLRRAEPPQRFSAPCEILSLEGSLSGGDPMLHVTLSRRTDNGVEVLGGRLTAGRVCAVELYLECFDDVSLTREKDRATGLWLWQGEARSGAAAPSARATPPSQTWTQAADDDDLDEDLEDDEDDEDDEDELAPAAPSSGGVSWADVAAVSAAPEVARQVVREPDPPPRKRKKKKREAPVGFKPPPLPEKKKTSEAEFMDEPIPEKGDFIQHRQFGLCKVEKEDGEGGIIIKLPSGVRKTIKLDYMEVGQPRMEGTRRVFPIRPRRR